MKLQTLGYHTGSLAALTHYTNTTAKLNVPNG
jgi:hypothetical protein